jgi:hypothetical protein
MMLLVGMNVQAQCPNTAAAITQQGTDCGANVNYAVTNDVGFQSIEWFLDNALLTTQASGTIYLDPGSYVFRVITIDMNICTNVYEEVVVVGPSFTVTIIDGDGGIACNGTLLLNSTMTGGSGNFAYQWSPANMMGSPTASATTMSVGSTTTEVSLTVTDLTLGCSFSASTTVYPNLPVIETLELCGTGDEVELVVDPGSMVYDWTATDPDGNSLDMSGVTGNSFSAIEPGIYTVFTYYSGCNPTTHQFTINACSLPCDQLTANVFSDSIACNGTLFIGPTVSGGSGDYSYQWDPAFAVNDPTAQGVQIQQSFPLWVSVTVTDNETGCTASDSVFVSPNIQQNQTVSLCNGSAELTLDPGSMVYNWTATDSDGNTIDMSGVTGNSFSATEPGIYEVMTYYSGCNEVVHEFVVEAGLEIIMPDTVFTCAGICEGTATATVTGGTPPYSFLWLTDGNTVATHNFLCAGTATVIVVDANGCTVSADVVVLEYPSTELEITYSETTENCITTICLSSVGYVAYLWSTGSMTAGICGFSEPGVYDADLIVVDAFGCTQTDSISFTVEAPCDNVWPGDVNHDGIADNDDLLWLGLAYGQNGPVRPDASLAWEGQPAPDWDFNFSGINVNLKHADTDGNGTVNFSDTVAISLNYGQTHGKTENALGGNIPALWVDAVPDTVAPGNGIVATVHLGSATQPVDSLHGIAFTLTFNDLLVDDADFTIDFSGNVLGTVGSDVMTLHKLFLPDGEVDVAVTRNTLQNFGGYGPLATFHIVTTDNLSGIHELRIGVSGVTAITAHGHAIELATVADTVIIDSDYVGIGEAFGAHLHIYPNPTDGIVRVDGLQGTVAVEVLDATGRVISRSGNSGSASLTIDLSGQPAGFYLLRLSGAEGVAVRRVVKGW